VASHDRRLAVVFQEPRLLPNLDVGDNVAFPLRMAGVARRERRERASALLDDVGLGGSGSRDPRHLSGGEQQRVALARALAGDPELLLLDEPLSAVDPSRREAMRQLISRLQRERSVTTLYVTHDRAEAAELGDRVALMVEGRIIQHAPPEELFSRPATAVVARFFGASNVLAGTVSSGSLDAGGVRVPVAAPDGRATVAIRPERFELDAGGPVRGTVQVASYHGTYRRLVVDCGGTEVEVHVDPDASIEPGDRVGLRIARRHIWLLAATPGTATTSERQEAS
jgi:putative spermidine/putrescine transport system ATP-binding protein